MGSILVTHSLSGQVSGLKEMPPDRQPHMANVFYSFRVMFGIAILMFAACAAGLYLHAKGRLFTTRWFHRFMLWMLPSGFLATLGGWYTAEFGRQPYVVFGQLLTREAVSPVAGSAVFSTLVIVACVYAVFLSGFLALAIRHIRRGPADAPTAPAFSGSLKRALMGMPASTGAATAGVAAGEALAPAE